MNHELTPSEVRRALDGEQAALRRLVTVLRPIIQARVARGLLAWRRGSASGRSVRQEVEDLTQEIFLALFDDDGKALRSWDPSRGLSLANFAGLVAERQTVSILRSGKRSPWKEDPTLDEGLDRESPEKDPEKVAASREELGLLLDRLTETLSPLGRHLFDLLFLRELEVSDVVATTGMSSDAVYAWRSRLRRLAHQIFGELSDPGRSRRRALIGEKA